MRPLELTEASTCTGPNRVLTVGPSTVRHGVATGAGGTVEATVGAVSTATGSGVVVTELELIVATGVEGTDEVVSGV